jgi:gliding motility-associated-like protein
MVGDGFGGRLWYKPTNFNAGSYSAYSICGENRQLYAWGRNTKYTFGNKDYNFKGSDTPVVVVGMTNTLFHSYGGFSAAIKTDNSGWIWGPNNYIEPTKIIEDVIFACGGSNATFIKKDGTVWSYGINSSGSFGNGEKTQTPATLPVKMNGIRDAVRVANSIYLTLVLSKDGSVSSVTCFNSGIADETYSTECLPKKVLGLKNIVDIKAGHYQSIALDSGGRVFSLINNTNSNSFEASAINSLSNIIAISAVSGGFNFFALDENGNCYGWGYNGNGQFGKGDSTRYRAPTLIATDIIDILPGQSFTYLVNENYELLASGGNRSFEGSVLMNHNYWRPSTFVKIDPTVPPMNLCKIKKTVHKNVNDSLCAGEIYTLDLDSFNKDTSFVREVSSSENTDSLVTYNITFLPQSSADITVSTCDTTPVFINNKPYIETGNYYDTLVNQYGCDSLLQIKVTNLTSTRLDTFVSICFGDSLFIDSTLYYTSGKFTDTLTNYKGCDSFFSVSLEVLYPSYFDTTSILCEGNRFELNNKYYSGSGIYYDTLSSYIGCDSIIQISIIENEHSYFDTSIVLCADESVVFSDTVRNVSGTYKQILTNYKNCDSVVTMHLFIKEVAHYKLDTLICPNDSFFLNNKLYHSPGIYYDSLTTQAGCDSFLTITIDTFKDFTCYDATVFIPNTFTPNSNDINEVFRPVGINIANVQMQIFNRWGEKLYDGIGKDIAWAGNYLNKPCQQGVYLYLIIITSESGKRTFFNGSVHLIR